MNYLFDQLLNKVVPGRKQKEVDDYFKEVDRRQAEALQMDKIREQMKVEPGREDPNSKKDKNYIYHGRTEDLSPPINPIISPSPVQASPPTLTPTPTQPPLPPNTLDFTGYKMSRPDWQGKEIAQPSKKLNDLFFKVFGPTNEATPAAAVAFGEGGDYNPDAEGINPAYNFKNKAGENVFVPETTDYGVMGINSGTFDGLKKRRPEEMAAIGITKDTPYSILKDPETNMRVGQLVRKDEEWNQSQNYGNPDFGQWYGWQGQNADGKWLGKGINLQEMIKKGEKYFIQKKAGSTEATKVGIECETKEHPTIPPESIKILVADHLKEDPKYYDDYMEDDEENNEEDDVEDEVEKE
jgi:hypothetical protein